MPAVLARGRWPFPMPRRPVLGGGGDLFGTGACAHLTLLVHLLEGGARALLCSAL